MKKRLIIVLAFTLLNGCQSNEKKEIAAEKAADSIEMKDSMLEEAVSVKRVIPTEVYEGILPCADCEGLKTKITFYIDTANTYKMEETYIDLNDNVPIVSTGRYTIERGYRKDEDAAVYVLNYDKPGKERCFVQFTWDPKHIVMLDKQRKIIKSNQNF